MAKLTLDIEYDYDFTLFGIVCFERDYRFCWALNKELGWKLEKTDDYELHGKKQELFHFTMYAYIDEELYREYYILSNKSYNFLKSTSVPATADLFGEEPEISDRQLLIPEQAKADYFILIKGNIDKEETPALLDKIKRISFVVTGFDIAINSLKSKQNLLF